MQIFTKVSQRDQRITWRVFPLVVWLACLPQAAHAEHAGQVSDQTLLLSVSATGEGLLVVQGFIKEVAYLVPHTGGAPYTYELLAADGTVLYREGFELPVLCTDPTHGVNDPPHWQGDVVIPHQVDHVIKVPMLDGLHTLRFFRETPEGLVIPYGQWQLPAEVQPR